VKVTFTCEKCGHVFREYEPVVNDFYIYQHQSDYQCPNCTKLSYGPLTEEMLAEALEEADVLDEYDAYIGMARFVLRLLDKVGEGFNGTRADLDDYWGNTRDWLLDLARQP
jgi:hypothetical protein